MRNPFQSKNTFSINASLFPCEPSPRAPQTRNSTFPFGPSTGDRINPFTANCCPSIKFKTSSNTRRCTCSSRITPLPFPTSFFPASNCGLISAINCPSSLSQPFNVGNKVFNEINDASTVTKSTGSGSDSTYLAFDSSITTTPESCLSFQSSCPFPPSIAYTFPAPCCNRQSVNPPVDAPTSAHTLPATSTAN